MKTIFIWIFVAIINPQNIVPEGVVPSIHFVQYFATDEECAAALRSGDIPHPRIKEIVVNQCFEAQYPTGPQTNVMAKPQLKASVYDKRGNLLGVGYNSYTKTHPRQAYFARLAGVERKTYLHAEIAAIIMAGRTGTRLHSIRVERWGRAGESRLAKPCPVCALAIEAAGIKEVSYTT